MSAPAPAQGSPPPDDRCGTCRWWPECDDPARWRLCRFPLAVPACQIRRQWEATTAQDGRGCPCWAGRP